MVDKINGSLMNPTIALLKKQFNALQFYDLSYTEEQASETSKVNQGEIDMIENLLWRFISTLIKHNNSDDRSMMLDFSERRENQKFASAPPSEQRQMAKTFKYKDHTRKVINQLKGLIGIVSPYKSQIRALKQQIYALIRKFGEIQNPQDFIEINTIDAY